MSVVVVTGAARGMGRAFVGVVRDLADHVIAVDLDAPATDGTAAVCFASSAAHQIASSHPTAGRFGRTEEVAAVVAFLLSDAASFVSGIDILVDGGGLEGFRRAFDN